jgi:hypothetical protein
MASFADIIKKNNINSNSTNQTKRNGNIVKTSSRDVTPLRGINPPAQSKTPFMVSPSGFTNSDNNICLNYNDLIKIINDNKVIVCKLHCDYYYYKLKISQKIKLDNPYIVKLDNPCIEMDKIKEIEKTYYYFYQIYKKIQILNEYIDSLTFIFDTINQSNWNKIVCTKINDFNDINIKWKELSSHELPYFCVLLKMIEENNLNLLLNKFSEHKMSSIYLIIVKEISKIREELSNFNFCIPVVFGIDILSDKQIKFNYCRNEYNIFYQNDACYFDDKEYNISNINDANDIDDTNFTNKWSEQDINDLLSPKLFETSNNIIKIYDNINIYTFEFKISSNLFTANTMYINIINKPKKISVFTTIIHNSEYDDNYDNSNYYFNSYNSVSVRRNSKIKHWLNKKCKNDYDNNNDNGNYDNYDNTLTVRDILNDIFINIANASYQYNKNNPMIKPNMINKFYYYAYKNSVHI